MAEQSDQEKTEDPTPQRREDFRKRGEVAQSKEIASILLLFSSVLVIWFLGRFFLTQLADIFTVTFTDHLVRSARDEDWYMAVRFAAVKSAMVVMPIAGVLWVMGVASTVLQIGFLKNEEALKFDPKRLDPVAGFKRLLSLKSLFEGAKAIFKVTIVVCIVIFIFQSELVALPKLSSFNVSQLFTYISTLLLKLISGVGVFMVVIAAFDFFFQRWDMEKKMRMTKQEVKEELKSREGDPLVRARVRKLQRELSTRRMMDDVRKADVIITNPTHIAVAIVYSDDLPAPKLVAKGAGDVAQRIKDVAKECKIPVMENKPLARTIYKTLEIGKIIPRELYNAVAEVLSYVYKLRRKKRA